MVAPKARLNVHILRLNGQDQSSLPDLALTITFLVGLTLNNITIAFFGVLTLLTHFLIFLTFSVDMLKYTYSLNTFFQGAKMASAYIEKINGLYVIRTAYGRYTRRSQLEAVKFCRANGFKPVIVGVI